MNKQSIKELLKKANEPRCCECGNGDTELFNDIIESLLQELDQYRWRNVKSDPPEKEGVYIVCIKGSKDISFTAYYAGNLHWETGTDIVTDWMPLPSPNKEGV